jgi:hypothetical protein
MKKEGGEGVVIELHNSYGGIVFIVTKRYTGDRGGGDGVQKLAKWCYVIYEWPLSVPFEYRVGSKDNPGKQVVISQIFLLSLD